MEFDEIVVKESPGLCRCCLSEGCYKDLGTEYSWMDDTEVYADMLLECFDISISQHNDGPNGPNRLICEVCITRLRDACNFKKQVQASEKKFVDMIGRGAFKSKVVMYQNPVKPEVVMETQPTVDPEVEYLEEEIDFVDDEAMKESETEQATVREDITVVTLPVKGKRGRPRKNAVVKTTKKVKLTETEDKPKTSKTVAKGDRKKNLNFDITDSENELEDEDVNIETFDGNLDEPFLDTRWVDYNDSEIEEGPTGNGEANEGWTNVGVFKRIPFEGKPGVNGAVTDDPYDYFELAFDHAFFTTTVNETNRRGGALYGGKWNALTVAEFKLFLSLLLHMGTIRCSKIDNYWDSGGQFGLGCFARHMSEARFKTVLRALRFSNGGEGERGLVETIPVIDYFNAKMRDIYSPNRELLIGQTLIPWRGSVMYGQCIPNRNNEYGIGLHTLCDSTGTVLRIQAYMGGDGTCDSGREEEVFNLLQDFLHRGHSVFMDYPYTSLNLVEDLIDCNTYCTCTLMKTSRAYCSDVTERKLSRNQVIFRYKNNIIYGKYREKRQVLFVSSEYRADVEEYERNGSTKVLKPIALHNHNEYMRCVYRRNEILQYYTCARRTFGWYTRLWVCLVETLLYSSFQMYDACSNAANKLNFYRYRLLILDKLIAGSRYGVPMSRIPVDHMPQLLPRGSNRKVQRKICRQCYKGGKYRRTNYYCPACAGRPGLCLGVCFKLHHAQRI